MALLTPLIPYNMILLLHHVMSSDTNTLSYSLNMEGNVKVKTTRYIFLYKEISQLELLSVMDLIHNDIKK